MKSPRLPVLSFALAAASLLGSRAAAQVVPFDPTLYGALAAAWQQHIMSILRRDGQVIAKRVSQDLGLSEDTIRRDLRELAAGVREAVMSTILIRRGSESTAAGSSCTV